MRTCIIKKINQLQQGSTSRKLKIMALAGKQALVVGGTNGIGRGIAEWFARNGASVVIGGRSRERGEEVVEAMRASTPGTLSPAATFSFAPVDVSLIKDTNRFTRDYASSSSRLDYLVLTAGIASFNGRTETSEGIDQKMAVHYYGRVSVINGLLPLLEKTAADGADVRVVSVFSAGVSPSYAAYRDDPDLKQNFSLVNCAGATGMYNDVAMISLAKEHPSITFTHAAPGFVASAWGSDFHWALRGLARFVQLFARSIHRCAEDLSPLITRDDWRGGARFSNPSARPTSVHSQANEATDFIWSHTKEVLERAGKQ